MEKGKGWGGKEAGSVPKLKLGPQNYFPGSGAVLRVKCSPKNLVFSNTSITAIFA